MGLRNIVSALLPIGYREQVLGDLQERGFRLGDIASAVPKIWWSYLHRSWTLPRFALGGAKDQILQQRVAQFYSQTRWAWALFLWAQLQPIVRWIHGPTAVSLLLECALLALLCFATRAGRDRFLDTLSGAPRPLWVSAHHHQLIRQRLLARLGVPYLLIPFAFTRLWKTFGSAPIRRAQGIGSFLVAVIVCLLLGQLRSRRLQREIEGLQNASLPR